MKLKVLLSISLALPLTGCGIFSDTGPSAQLATGAIIGTLSGAGIGAIIGSVISDGDVGESALLGAGVGLAVGLVGSYAYDKIKVENEIASNDESIELNRRELLLAQNEIDALRQEMYEDSRSIVVDSSKREKIYNGATLGVYYR